MKNYTFSPELYYFKNQFILKSITSSFKTKKIFCALIVCLGLSFSSNIIHAQDTDGDSINDIFDLDDDNDGILDSIELNCNVPLLGQTFDQNNANTITINNLYSYDPDGAGPLAPITASFSGTLENGDGDPRGGDGPNWNGGIENIGNDLIGTQAVLTDFQSGRTVLYALTFSEPVYNLQFNWGGLDNGDRSDFFINTGAEIIIRDIDANDSGNSIFTDTSVRSDEPGGPLTENIVRVYTNGPVTQVEIRIAKDNVDNTLNNGNITLSLFDLSYCASVNTDEQEQLDYLDLDSDNDGIPDLVEASGVDIDGNGMVDGFIDINDNGVADIYEATTNFGTLDTDNDSIGNRLDLDSDNDGITDLVETLGIDNDTNGLVDGFTDTNNNGYHDAFEGLNSILITGNDTNNDGVADSYPNANIDANGLPNFLDIDADDDGITDNTEAQSTSSFITYNTTDSDGDGIPNSFDNLSGFGGNGLNPIDTDFDCIPDFLDINSDDDTEDDIIEGHDTNGDGIVNGSDTPNANTGTFTGIDSDNDGLDNGFDNNDSAFNPSNNLNPTSHPQFDALHDRDWRASNSPIDFDGVDDYIDFGDQHDITGAFTLEAWVLQNNTTSSTNAGIISKRDVRAGNERGYHLAINNSNQPNLAWYNNSGNKILDITSPVSIRNGVWYHIAASFNGTQATIYINGENVITAPGATSVVNGDEKFFIGAMYDSDLPCVGARNYFDGHIDEVRIWNDALSTLQIHEMMNQEIQNNSGTVRGAVVPRDISNSLPWNTLSGYYTMENNVIQDRSLHAVNGFPKFINSTQAQTAPLPYISAQNGDWDDQATWLNGSVQSILPGQISEFNPSVTIDCNIAKVNHIINMNNAALPAGTNNGARGLLGLLVETSSELTLNGTNNLTSGIGTGNGLLITHYLKLNGKIDLEGESQLVQTLDSQLDPTSSGLIEKDQQGTRDLYTYNYWSSPVGVQNNTSNNNSYTFADIYRDGTDSENPKLINFITSGFNGTPNQGPGNPIGIADYWIFKFADFEGGNIAGFQQVRSTGALLPGQGFTLKGVENTAGNVELNQNYVIQGKPNNGDINLNISAGNNYLVGNPYASALDANQFILDNGPVIDGGSGDGSNPVAGITGTLYFWDHFGGGSHILREYQGGYATYSLAGGTPPAISEGANSHPDLPTSGIGSLIPGRYVPVGQGFFILGESDGTVNFNNGQRQFVTENIGSSVFFGIEDENFNLNSQNNTSNESSFPSNQTDDRLKIRIGLNTVNTIHRQLLLTRDVNTSLSIDWGYDAPLNEDQIDDAYWVIEDFKYNIQATNIIDTETVLPIGFHIANDGDNSFTIDALENVPDDLFIYLHDKELEIYHDLRSGDYDFFALTGEHLDRFDLIFTNTSNDTLSTDDFIIENLEIYYSNETNSLVILNPLFQNLKSLEVYSILGQSIFKENKIPTENKISYNINNNITTGVYIINLNTDKGTLAKKVLID